MMHPLFAAPVLAMSLAVGPQDHQHLPQLGSLSFESSCSESAKPSLQIGLGWLHSFEYGEAAKSFREAAIADPHCGIAHWGVAMSYYHPLWEPPSPGDLEAGRAALALARQVGAKSARERGLIDALGTFYRDSDRLDHRQRLLAYMEAMGRLRGAYADDREISVFYALAQIAAGTLDKDPNFELEHKAAAILNDVLKAEPDHPGVAHYLIHSFDYPPLAHYALPAAQRYASIAPASAHAQHMPSHIFIRLGMWDEAISSNLAAEAAARDYARTHGMQDSWDERLHAMDYLAYAYLQVGRDRDALAVMDQLNAIKSVDPPNFKVAYTITAVPARLALERRNWRAAATLELAPQLRSLAPLDKLRWPEAHLIMARAIGAARSGDASQARKEVDRLVSIERSLVVPAGTYDWKTQVSIARQIAEAWLAYAEHRKVEALSLMRAAADLDDATEKHPVTPGSIAPAREQLGELLLETGQPREALTAFEASLKRAPRRLAGLYGAARAAMLASDATAAARHYSELASVTGSGDGSRPEIREARQFVASVARRGTR